MKILHANAGVLTNCEVLEFLRSRGAAKDPTRVLVSIAPSEFKVYDYLEQSAARDQTKETIADFMDKSKKYDLAKAEVLNIINIRPSTFAELDPIVEEWEKRLGEEGGNELANLVSEVLPPPPPTADEEEDVPDEQREQMKAKDADGAEGEDVQKRQKVGVEDADVEDEEDALEDEEQMETS